MLKEITIGIKVVNKEINYYLGIIEASTSRKLANFNDNLF